MVTTLMKIGLALVIFCPINSNASDDISRKADRYAALFERYGWHIEKKDVAIIDRESRRLNTSAEYAAIGKSVGTFECKGPRGKTASTAYVVGKNVIRVTGHAAYEKVLDKNRFPTGKLKRVIVSLRDECVFGLRDVNSENVVRYKIEATTECAPIIPDESHSRCDWAVAKTFPLPSTANPLNTLMVAAEMLNGLPIVAVGHHRGAKLNGKVVLPKVRLVDYGYVMAKSKNSILKSYDQMIQYTVDTHGVASGQPIIAQVDQELYVVASHKGEYRREDTVAAPFNDHEHLNYGVLHNNEMFEAVRRYDPDAGRYQFEPPVEPLRFNKRITIY